MYLGLKELDGPRRVQNMYCQEQEDGNADGQGITGKMRYK